MDRGLGGRISFSVFLFLSFSEKFEEKKYFIRRCIPLISARSSAFISSYIATAT